MNQHDDDAERLGDTCEFCGLKFHECECDDDTDEDWDEEE